jgi:hypothetical protein
MPIEMTFTADDVAELKTQIRAFANMLAFEHRPDPLPYTQEKTVQEPVQGSPDVAKPQDTAKPRSHKKATTKAPVAEPEASEDEVEEEAPVEQTTAANGNGAAAVDTVAAMKVKDAVIPILQEAFAAGKAPKLRVLLETYGGGAKSFPEIAPENFLGIQKAINDGALKD